MNSYSINLQNFLLIVLVVFIPYTSILLFGNPYLFIPMVLYLVYMGLNIRRIKFIMRTRSIRTLLWPIVALWFFILFSSLINFNSIYSDITRSVLQRIVIYFIFFIVVYNELHADTKLQGILQKTIVFSIFVMAGFYFSGTGVEFVQGRLSIFGSNPNTIGVWASVVIIFSADLIIRETNKPLYLIYYLIAIAAAIVLIVFSGSRKAIVMVVMGVLVYYVFLDRSVTSKLMILIPLVVFSLIAYKYVSSTDIFIQRVTTELNRQDLGGRTPIWEAAIEILKTSPYIGVGVGEFSYQIEYYLGRVRDTHNEFIQIAAYSGILGLSCFLLFLYGVAKKVFSVVRDSAKSKLSLLLALFSMQILYLFSAGGALTSFYSWFIFAYIVAKSEPEASEEFED